ncbi:MAG: carotenoid oxygenase family protein [Sandaracinaceae bacterium]
MRPIVGIDIAPFRTSDPAGSLEVEVEGDLPPDLRGRLLRTTPAGLAHAGWAAEHWFDGLCMLYRFTLGERPTFRSAWLDSDFKREVEAGRVTLGSFATRRNPPFWHWLLHPIQAQTDNCNVNVVRHGDRYLALTETNRTLEVDPETLAVRGRFAYEGEVASAASTLAHPRYHAGRERIITLCTTYGPSCTVEVAAMVPGSGARARLNAWSTPRWPYLHDFGLTDRFAVILAVPFTLYGGRLLWATRGLARFLRYDEGAPLRLIVVPLDGGEPRLFETDGCFIYHLFNAYEADGEIILDAIEHGGGDAISKLEVAAIAERRPDLGGRASRLRLDLARGRVTREPLTDAVCEFPRINDRRAHMRPYRYGYAASLVSLEADGERRYEGSLLKVDTSGGETRAYADHDWIPGEPIFVPRAADGDLAEDDGYVLSVASHRREERTRLWVLDATTLEPRATLTVPTLVPLGFHGHFARA